MTIQQINEFKEEMKYYKWLKETIRHFEIKANDLLYEMTGVKGVRYDKTTSLSINEELVNLKKLDMIERYDELITKIEEYKDRFNKLERVLNAMTIYERNMFLFKFDEEMTYQEVANKYHISKTGLFYRMNKALERVEI